MTEQEYTHITIRVKPEIKQALQITAIKEHTSMNTIITQLITDYLNNRK